MNDVKLNTIGILSAGGGGASGGGGGSASSWKYYDVSAISPTNIASEFPAIMLLVKILGSSSLEQMTGSANAVTTYYTFSVLDIETACIKAFGVDVNMIVDMGQKITFGDVMMQLPSYQYLREITEEEFYSLNTPA